MSNYVPQTPRSIPEVRAELNKVAAAIESVLHRDGTAPNQMEADLDMNGNDILNALFNGEDIQDVIDDAKDAASNANSAADNANETAEFLEDRAAELGVYNGLWPDTGGSANKGDTYQTQVSGTPTGQYFTALKNTTIDPFGDNVNWRAVIGADLGEVTNGTRLKHRRGTDAEILAGTPELGELWFNITDNSIHMGDGVTQGGIKQTNFVNVKNFGAKGDGVTDDTAAIQSAIMWATTNGLRTVVAADGRFKYTSITLTGITLTGDGVMVKNSSSDNGIIMLGNEPTIDGLRFEPEYTSRNPSCDIKLGDGCYNPTIRNCVFYSPNGQTIYSAIGSAIDPVIDPNGDFPYNQNIRKLQITNNIFEGYTRPVYLFCLDGYSITDNRFEGSDFDAVRIREVVGDGNISDNLFINVGDTSAGDEQTRDAIDTAWSGFNLTIANNTIKGIAYVGIDVKGTSATADYGSGWITITGNYIEDTHLSGIAVSGIGRFNISNNMLKGCNSSQGSVGDAAILFKDNGSTSYMMARGNMVTSNYGRGIFVEGGNSQVIISENICMNNSDSGIQIVCNYGVVAHNQCVNEPSLTNGDTQLYGITFLGTASSNNSVIVEGNICKNNISYQMNFIGSGHFQDMIHSWKSNYEEGNNAYGGTSSFARFAAKEPRVRWSNGTTNSSSAGTFNVGDILYYDTPVAGGYIGRVCTVAGTPGTWKDFGSINA